MTTPQSLVGRFYHELWNRADEAVAPLILAPNFRFRGSLGPEKTGVEGFLEYHRSVHASLENFECIIEDLLVSGSNAAARMLFRGRNQGELFGIAATGAEIQWAGAAFFATDGDKITSLWVLGDVDGVKRQLGHHGAAPF